MLWPASAASANTSALLSPCELVLVKMFYKSFIFVVILIVRCSIVLIVLCGFFSSPKKIFLQEGDAINISYKT
ncbi:hypothetical protein NECAME_09465 [Necator americanus]|uniref:Uncharacterized protein n=1 Tax=Necator americanus TaxID=51031 RepID=W2TFI7_NECAM|nr:hypothetical protein NECAME_09465 [Necator americanus]ETN79961.1 hypothetical protein NECAME_09465 [Necator americanus]